MIEELVRGRSFIGTKSLNRSLTQIPRGTTNCCYEHAEENLLRWVSDQRTRKREEVKYANHE